MIFYIETPEEIVMEQMSKRAGKHFTDIIPSKETARQYYKIFKSLN